MKRQGDNIKDQPPVKKPDVSTDLRSKIGAKLQTLLNGIQDSRLYIRHKRRLYADLLGKTQHSQIIIDPTIVIKTEEPEVEECSNDSSTLLTSQNFLISAKSRLTELLNKKQDGASKFKDNEKENTLSSNKCSSSSPGKSNSCQSQASYKFQSRPSNSLNKKRKISSSREYSNSTSDATNSQVCLKNLVVVVEDIMNSKNRTKFTHLLPKHLDNQTNFSNQQSTSGHASVKDNNADEVVSSLSNDEVNLCADESTASQLNPDVQVLVPECYITENNSELNISRSESPEIIECVLLNDCNSKKVVHLEDVIFDREETINQIPCSNEDNSELVDDPTIPQVIVDVAVDESISSDNTPTLSSKNPEPEVVLLCVKKPTHEVITLEDNEDLDDVIEEVHECDQCGKAFRAKSLLSFHVRMHGNDVSTSPPSSSHSFS